MTKAKAVPPRDKSPALTLKDVPGKTRDRVLADMVVQGVAMNALAVARFIGPCLPGLSLDDMVASLKVEGEAVNRGDLRATERMLNAQAVALNVIFGELARRAAANMGEHLHATELYMRLALKAQSQSRATAETLAAIKNPPVVFARQANIAHGPQQVNNGTAQKSATDASTVTDATAHAGALPPPSGEGATTLDDRLTPRTNDVCVAGMARVKN